MFLSKNYDKYLYKVINLLKGISLGAIFSTFFFGLSAAQGAVPEDLYNKEASKKGLSLAGGGACGFIELVWLSQLEKKTELPIHKLFDVIGGTSIGGILAIMLTAPGKNGEALYTATSLVDKFEDIAKRIFTERCLNPWGLRASTYIKEGIAGVAEDYLGDLHFNQCLTPTMVTSYNMDTNYPKFFKSWRREHSDFKDADVALATSAAETYFPPHSMQKSGPSGGSPRGKIYHLLDGGNAANDPCQCLATEAEKMFGKNCNLQIVALGTGHLNSPLPFQELENAGVLSWVQLLANIFMAGQMGVTDYLMKKHYGDAYSRWNPEIIAEHGKLDSYKPEDLEYFKSVTLAMIKDRQSEFDALAASLVAAAKVRSPKRIFY